jgi:hypothetical protein
VSWGDIAAIVVAIATVAGLNLGAVRWLLDRREQKAGRIWQRIDELDSSQDKLSERVSVLERNHENSPDWETMNGLKDAVAEFDGDLKGLRQEIRAVHEEQGHQRDSIRRIEDHLLESKGHDR